MSSILSESLDYKRPGHSTDSEEFRAIAARLMMMCELKSRVEICDVHSQRPALSESSNSNTQSTTILVSITVPVMLLWMISKLNSMFSGSVNVQIIHQRERV